MEDDSGVHRADQALPRDPVDRGTGGLAGHRAVGAVLRTMTTRASGTRERELVVDPRPRVDRLLVRSGPEEARAVPFTLAVIDKSLDRASRELVLEPSPSG